MRRCLEFVFDTVKKVKNAGKSVSERYVDFFFLVGFLAGLQTELHVGAGLSSVKDINKSFSICWDSR